MSEQMRRNTNYEIQIVTNSEQMCHAYAIRAICYMQEHGKSARQVYDANDYMATHLVMYENDEPIGTIRIRWFGEFAKFERMSFLPGHRNPYIIKKLAVFAFDFCACKGFKQVITHARPRYAQLWVKILGFVLSPKQAYVFKDGDSEIVELVKTLEPAEEAVGMASDINVLFRTEGQWNVKTAFESGSN